MYLSLKFCILLSIVYFLFFFWSMYVCLYVCIFCFGRVSTCWKISITPRKVAFILYVFFFCFYFFLMNYGVYTFHLYFKNVLLFRLSVLFFILREKSNSFFIFILFLSYLNKWFLNKSCLLYSQKQNCATWL